NYSPRAERGEYRPARDRNPGHAGHAGHASAPTTGSSYRLTLRGRSIEVMQGSERHALLSPLAVTVPSDLLPHLAGKPISALGQRGEHVPRVALPAGDHDQRPLEILPDVFLEEDAEHRLNLAPARAVFLSVLDVASVEFRRQARVRSGVTGQLAAPEHV